MEIIVWVATDRVGSKMERTVKVDKEEWEGMNDHEKNEYMWEEIMNWSMIEWGYEEKAVEED